ncbi:hypothetical protein [Aeromicrobium tamlense]|nr:hypothetical protein [Aeromicrobium tamlense]NYI38126.1 membrane protein [Aeromicrobium tamlense]
MRIEFIDRCMLIAAQGLLALIPVLVVLSAFLPQLSDAAVRVFATAAGVGAEGTAVIGGEVSLDQVRTQTGVIGLLITIFSASSFARAIQRMYESVWGIGHIGGVSGFRRCLTWLIGWLVTLQFVAALRTLIRGIDGGLGDAIGFGLQCVILSAIWWVTAWMLLFGRVSWASLALGAWLTGCLGVLYNRISARVMPIYVDANADQFGTLGVILAVTTWLIGFAGVMVASALVGRVVWEETSLSRVAKRLKLTR